MTDSASQKREQRGIVRAMDADDRLNLDLAAGAPGLPAIFDAWFRGRGWEPRPHQLELMQLGLQGRSSLLVAPTGGGKTLGGFLASLVELAHRRPHTPGAAGKWLHTLYISPLKSLAVDVKRNL